MAIITINPDKTISINGKRIFPILIRNLCDPGVTTDILCTEKYQNMPWNSVLFGTVLPSAQILANTKLFITRMNTTAHELNPLFMGFYQPDEPLILNLPAIEANYQIYKNRDINHIIMLGQWLNLPAWVTAADVFITGLYPFREGFIDDVESKSRDDCIYIFEHLTRFSLGISNFNNFPKPVWMGIQAVSATDESGTLRLTAKEVRVLVYASLTMDTQGVFIYTGNTAENALVSDPVLLQIYINQIEELKSLENILLLPTKDFSWQYRKGTLVSFSTVLTETVFGRPYTNYNWILKQDGNIHYLIIVNKDVRSVTTTISISGLMGTLPIKTLGLETTGSGRVGRTLTSNNGSFTDSFDGLAVHIYQISDEECPPSQCDFTITQ